MIFDSLRVIDTGNTPGSGPWNMAVDEALHRSVAEPTLRFYRWTEPTVTIGYFQKLAVALEERPGQAIVRRWTGGGLVDHGMDWTYSLFVPAGHPLLSQSREQSYLAVHAILRDFLTASGVGNITLADASPLETGECFVRPVRGDLLFEGQKIAGAAQRRTRAGLLHQGSVQNLTFRQLAVADFAHRLARAPTFSSLSPSENVAAEDLRVQRYSTLEWLALF